MFSNDGYGYSIPEKRYLKYLTLDEPCDICRINRFDKKILDDHVEVYVCQNCGAECYYATGSIQSIQWVVPEACNTCLSVKYSPDCKPYLDRLKDVVISCLAYIPDKCVDR